MLLRDAANDSTNVEENCETALNFPEGHLVQWFRSACENYVYPPSIRRVKFGLFWLYSWRAKSSVKCLICKL